MPNRKRKNYAPEIELVRENYGGEVYEYYPLGKYVVVAPGVCGGRPTIKYTRIDARHVIGRLRVGDRPRQVARDYHIPLAAVREAVELSARYDYEQSYA
jgi:uncharacterized protein (DUF433 family)